MHAADSLGGMHTSSNEGESMNEYEVEVNGLTITVQLDAEEAERRGLKAKAPANKSKTPANKSGEAGSGGSGN